MCFSRFPVPCTLCYVKLLECFIRQHSEMISLPYINNFRRQQAKECKWHATSTCENSPGYQQCPSPGGGQGSKAHSAISEGWGKQESNCPPGLETESQNATQHPPQILYRMDSNSVVPGKSDRGEVSFKRVWINGGW